MKKLTLFFTKVDKHEVFIMASSLAYTTALALAPFILIILSLLSWLRLGWEDKIFSLLIDSVGVEASVTIQSVIENAQKHPRLSGISGAIGFLVLCISASAIFSQLRVALDKINEHVFPESTIGVWAFLKDRLLSLGLVFAFAFLSIVSLLVSAVIALFYPNDEGFILSWISLLFNFLLFSGLFTTIYRFIPSQHLSWKKCFVSGVVSTIFYMIRKKIISLYLGNIGIASSYGAAGSLVVFLAWVYYTSITLLMSYELSIHFLPYQKKEV